MSEQRKHPRIPMKCRVKVIHADIGEVVVNTRDISDGGIFLITDPVEMPPIGTVVKGQVQDMPGGEGPVLQLEIVRVESGGIGLRFVNV